MRPGAGARRDQPFNIRSGIPRLRDRMFHQVPARMIAKMGKHCLHTRLRRLRLRSRNGVVDLTPLVASGEVAVDFYFHDRFAPVARPKIIERVDNRAKPDQNQQSGHHHFLQDSHRSLLRNTRKTGRGVVQCEAAPVECSFAVWRRGTAPFALTVARVRQAGSRGEERLAEKSGSRTHQRRVTPLNRV
jgi:hypothetical protein